MFRFYLKSFTCFFAWLWDHALQILRFYLGMRRFFETVLPSRGDGPRHLLHPSTNYREFNDDLTVVLWSDIVCAEWEYIWGWWIRYQGLLMFNFMYKFSINKLLFWMQWLQQMISAANFAQDCNNWMITWFVTLAWNAVVIAERWQMTLAVATRKTNRAQHLRGTPIIALKTLIRHWHNSNL